MISISEKSAFRLTTDRLKNKNVSHQYEYSVVLTEFIYLLSLEVLIA